MSLKLPTTLPATLDLGHGFTITFRRTSHYLWADIREGVVEIASDAADWADEALLQTLSSPQIDDARFPAPVALALRDLAHEAVDLVTARMSAEPVEAAVFAEESLPITAPDYDPETHEWKVGDWFEVCDDDGEGVPLWFSEKFGDGPYQVSRVTTGRVWIGDWNFSSHDIYPCPAPTRKETADA